MVQLIYRVYAVRTVRSHRASQGHRLQICSIGGTKMGAILKSHRYRLVDNNDFDLPLPLKFQVYKKDCPIAEY